MGWTAAGGRQSPRLIICSLGRETSAVWFIYHTPPRNRLRFLSRSMGKRGSANDVDLAPQPGMDAALGKPGEQVSVALDGTACNPASPFRGAYMPHTIGRYVDSYELHHRRHRIPFVKVVVYGSERWRPTRLAGQRAARPSCCRRAVTKEAPWAVCCALLLWIRSRRLATKPALGSTSLLLQELAGVAPGRWRQRCRVPAHEAMIDLGMWGGKMEIDFVLGMLLCFGPPREGMKGSQSQRGTCLLDDSSSRLTSTPFVRCRGSLLGEEVISAAVVMVVLPFGWKVNVR